MAYRRIHVKGDYRQDEKNAGAAVSPGMLLERNSADAVIAHNKEGGYAERMFAGEDALQGKTVSDAYASAAKVTLLFPVVGSEMNVLLAAGENVSIGDELVSDGAGALKDRRTASSPTSAEQVLAIAAEAKDNSAGLTATLMKVCVI